MYNKLFNNIKIANSKNTQNKKAKISSKKSWNIYQKKKIIKNNDKKNKTKVLSNLSKNKTIKNISTWNDESDSS